MHRTGFWFTFFASLAVTSAAILFGDSPVWSLVLYFGLAGMSVCAIVATRYTWRRWRGRNSGVNEKSGDHPRRPKGSTGFLFENCSRAVVAGNHLQGFDNGIVDVGGTDNLHVGNTITSPQAPSSKKQQTRRRKFFGGFSFSKGDHLKER